MSPRTGAARRRALARDRMGLMRIRRDVISMNPLASSLPFHEPPMAMHCSPQQHPTGLTGTNNLRRNKNTSHNILTCANVCEPGGLVRARYTRARRTALHRTTAVTAGVEIYSPRPQ